MNQIKKYPLALQLLMQTDGTVTELIKLLANEDIKVIKLFEEIDSTTSHKILHRHIYLQGNQTKINWLFAQSKIYLNNLPIDFVNDLLHASIPIGSLWLKYKTETFKQVISKHQSESKGLQESGFEEGVQVLSRTYHVFSQSELIMELNENFPIDQYEGLINDSPD